MCVWEARFVLPTPVSAFVCLFAFFYLSRDCWLWGVNNAHQWVPCTIHKTFKPHFLATFSLKMGPTILFTHLKIILLQCFQFSIVSKRTLSVINYFLSVIYFQVKIFLGKKKKNRTMGWIVHHLPVYTISLTSSVFIFQSMK